MKGEGSRNMSTFQTDQGVVVDCGRWDFTRPSPSPYLQIQPYAGPKLWTFHRSGEYSWNIRLHTCSINLFKPLVILQVTMNLRSMKTIR